MAMTTQESALPVLGLFSFTSLLETDADPERALLVDVGRRGQSLLHEIEAARGQIGKVRVILQNRKAVLDAISDENLPGSRR